MYLTYIRQIKFFKEKYITKYFLQNYSIIKKIKFFIFCNLIVQHKNIQIKNYKNKCNQ